MPAALFGITDDGLNLAVNLIVLFLVVVYFALIVWTYMDARRRLEDPVLVGSATVASLFPFVGPLVYSILRPPEFLADKRERELEIRSAELRVRQLEESSCPQCAFPIERSYLRCPSCKARVKDPCESCGKPIDPRWSLCPYCEAPVRRAAAPPSPGKRRAKAPAAAPSGERRRKRPSEAAPRVSEGEGRQAAPRASRGESSKQRASRPSKPRQASAKQRKPAASAKSPPAKESPAARPPPDGDEERWGSATT